MPYGKGNLTMLKNAKIIDVQFLSHTEFEKLREEMLSLLTRNYRMLEPIQVKHSVVGNTVTIQLHVTLVLYSMDKGK